MRGKHAQRPAVRVVPAHRDACAHEGALVRANVELHEATGLDGPVSINFRRRGRRRAPVGRRQRAAHVAGNAGDNGGAVLVVSIFWADAWGYRLCTLCGAL